MSGLITALTSLNGAPFKPLTINIPADFPTTEVADSQSGRLYIAGQNVTDNDPSKTNTGQSFLVGETFFWNVSTQAYIIVSGSGAVTQFSDADFRVFDDGDNSKILAFQCSGITTAITRTLTIPDTNSTILTSDGFTSLGGAWSMGNQPTTNVNIDSGTIDGVTLGTNSIVTQANIASLGINEASPVTLIEATSTAPYFTFHNSTQEDTEGGRESQISFKGEQSGGEESTLARIEAAHDGTDDDEKGDLIFYTNDGSDGNSPTERFRIAGDNTCIFSTGDESVDARMSILAKNGFNAYISFIDPGVLGWNIGLAATSEDFVITKSTFPTSAAFLVRKADQAIFLPDVYADIVSTSPKILSIQANGQLGESTTATPTFGSVTLINLVNEFSIDGTLVGDSDSAVPTEKAVKTYVDGVVGGSVPASTIQYSLLVGDATGGWVEDTSATLNTGALTVLSLDSGNIKIDENTISSTDTDGNILLTPDGAGAISNSDVNLTDNLFKLNQSNGVEALDQQQLGGNATIADNNAWQSFTPSLNGYLTKITVNQFSGVPATGKTLTIRFGEGAGGTVLATETGLTIPIGVSDIPITNPPFLNSGQLYTIKFAGGANLAWRINTAGGYAGGRSSNDPNRDFYFRTFMEAEFNFVFRSDTPAIGIGVDAPTESLDILGSVNISVGEEYKINGTSVLNATTLGSAVINSSLTSVGTLTSLTIGDPTNKTEFASDGLQTMAGTARIKRHATIKAEEFKLGASPPSAAIIGNFSVLQFTGTGATEEVFSSFHVPTDWAVGTDINISVYWAPVDANAGTVVWQMAWSAVASEANEVISGAGTTTSIADATQTLQDELLKSGDMTITGASLALEDTIGMQIFRDPAHVSDTYTSDASLVIVEISYTSDKLGEAL